ncbi:hypothetical protein Tco_0991402 [Tanacetum coccineum]|uniref:Uncharacterized protein n=1 Tax=Tanacetum coccineum TaxID=301880 RepID=A0ABQ5EZY6_9ASTR
MIYSDQSRSSFFALLHSSSFRLESYFTKSTSSLLDGEYLTTRDEPTWVPGVALATPDLGVDLRLARVCELGLLNYKAKHVFYPFEKRNSDAAMITIRLLYLRYILQAILYDGTYSVKNNGIHVLLVCGFYIAKLTSIVPGLTTPLGPTQQRPKCAQTWSDQSPILDLALFTPKWLPSVYHVFSFDSIKKINDHEVVTNYVRIAPRGLPSCGLAGNHSADMVSSIEVLSSVTKPNQAAMDNPLADSLSDLVILGDSKQPSLKLVEQDGK